MMKRFRKPVSKFTEGDNEKANPAAAIREQEQVLVGAEIKTTNQDTICAMKRKNDVLNAVICNPGL